jgi:hypothetical protein
MSLSSIPLEVSNDIIAQGSLGEFCALTAVSQSTRASAPGTFLKRVHHWLRSFDLPPVRFLPLLGDGTAVASGSFVVALALAPQAAFTPGDLDIYVIRRGYPALVRGLKTIGYRLLDQYDSSPHQYVDCKNILENVEVFGTETGSKYLNIITVSGDDPRAAIFLFHSTAVMNYIDATSITIGYPTLTLRGFSLTNEWNTLPAPKRLACWNKYRERGFTFFSTCADIPGDAHECGVAAGCYRTERKTDDGKCLTFVFDVETTPQTETFPSPLSWHLARRGVMESGYVVSGLDLFGMCFPWATSSSGFRGSWTADHSTWPYIRRSAEETSQRTSPKRT